MIILRQRPETAGIKYGRRLTGRKPQRGVNVRQEIQPNLKAISYSERLLNGPKLRRRKHERMSDEKIKTG